MFFKVSIFSVSRIFRTRNTLLKQKMNLLFRNHRHEILWRFQNIFFSFSFPKTHFSTQRPIQMENCSGFNKDMFLSYQKKKPSGDEDNGGMVCFHGILYKNLFKMGYASSLICPTDTYSPEGASCLLNARDVAWWGCCPTSSPPAVMLSWEDLFLLHELKPGSIYCNTRVKVLRTTSFLLSLSSPSPKKKTLARVTISLISQMYVKRQKEHPISFTLFFIPATKSWPSQPCFCMSSQKQMI